ncbi:unnamed protein product [Lactuca saligna]|uniref:Uncharacterized protein n=1 Tax=Lactuca saligna TaxID=75948 RepID=A0AA35Y258_LACSI|nr:unnamed protein product [Lactuca saligna]
MESNHSSYAYTSMNKSMDESDTATTEESGWTAYFEDFMVAQQQDHHNNHSVTEHDYYHHQQQQYQHQHQHRDHQQQQQDHDGPLLSDVASHVEWNTIDNSMSGVAPKFTKKLNLFKKTSRRTREILYDDSLEDTASSPVNSPKVGSQHMGFNQIKVDDIIENSLGKRGAFEDQNMERGFEEHNNGSTDLRKRGLCLVPLSMFVNYI